MEYKVSTESTTWTPASATETTGLTAGTYNVRYAAKTGFNAGVDAVVAVGSSDATITGGALEGVPLAGDFAGGAGIGASSELTVTVFGGATDDILGLIKGNANSVINYVVGSGTPASDAAHTLTYGSTTIDTTTTPTIIWLLVTAEDATTKLYYKITATAASSVATVTSATYTVSAGGTAAERIINVPFGTAKATFLAALAKGESHQTWNDAAIADPVVSTNTLVVTAQDGSTVVTYTVTTNAELSHDAALLGGTLGGVALSGVFTGTSTIGSSSGSSVTLPAGGTLNLVLTKSNANSTIKYVLKTDGSQPTDAGSYTGTYSDSPVTTIGITSSSDRIWLMVTAQDGITVRYCWIASVTILAVGNSYGGGKVAYIFVSGDTGYVPGEVHGLIAATSDQSVAMPWATVTWQGTAVTGTVTSVGYGLANTGKIIAQQNGAAYDTYAAGVARAYTGGGYSDWYLPSKDELAQLYQNRVAIGNFAITDGGYYWSSSEYDNTTAWIQSFANGDQYSIYKYYIRNVRAVRAF
jgi:hypothetical protein